MWRNFAGACHAVRRLSTTVPYHTRACMHATPRTNRVVAQENDAYVRLPRAPCFRCPVSYQVSFVRNCLDERVHCHRPTHLSSHNQTRFACLLVRLRRWVWRHAPTVLVCSNAHACLVLASKKRSNHRRTRIISYCCIHTTHFIHTSTHASGFLYIIRIYVMIMMVNDSNHSSNRSCS